MGRRVFFSFHWDRDNWRIGQVRNCWVTQDRSSSIVDAAEWETVKLGGEAVIKRWIDNQLTGTSVTAVLIGNQTATRKWVKYEIAESIARGKGLIGIRIHGLKDRYGNVDAPGANPLPAGYQIYNWTTGDGYNNLTRWVESAALAAGR